MNRVYFLALLLIGISSCKKYLDPKFTYTQPIMEFKANGSTITADSASAFIDSLHLDTSKTFTFFTNINSFRANEQLINIRIQGKSLGNYIIGGNTSLSFRNPENGNIFAAQSGNIVINEWDKKAKVISGSFFATSIDSLGSNVKIESGNFNTVQY